MIPKIIHQTWYNNDLPIEYINIIEHNKKLNPNFIFKFYTDKDIDNILENNKNIISSFISNAYYKINPKYGPARADLFRYLIIYLEGGIYLDMKIKILEPLEKWIDFKNDIGVVSYWHNFPHQRHVLKNERGEYQNWFLIFQKKDENMGLFLFYICQNILKSNKIFRGKEDVLHITGPIPYTRFMEKRLKYPYRRIESVNFLDYGNSFHIYIKQGTTNHYTSLFEPILLKSTFIDNNIKLLNNIPKFFNPGLYIINFTNSQIYLRESTFYSKLFCNGIDLIIGVCPEFWIIGTNQYISSLSIIEYFNQFNFINEIIEYIDDKLIKKVSIEKDDYLYKIIFYNKIYYELYFN